MSLKSTSLTQSSVHLEMEERKMTMKKMITQKEGCTMEDVAKHNKKGDMWVVLNGRVLNVSNFLSQHPGGSWQS